MTATKTVLITGAGSGIGRAAVERFGRAGWTVAATMRTPDQAAPFDIPKDRLHLFPLDVTDGHSIDAAIAAAIAAMEHLDVVVNNAGYGLLGPFEQATPEQIRRQFETNVFGPMAVCRAVLPHMRARASGTIINVASVGGRLAFPYYSVYHATKWAVDGFSESLAYELAQYGVSVKIIEPGPIKTEFYGRSEVRVDDTVLGPYRARFKHTDQRMKRFSARAPGPGVVADAIYRAATDGTARLRYLPAAGGLLALRRILPDRWFRFGIETALGV